MTDDTLKVVLNQLLHNQMAIMIALSNREPTGYAAESLENFIRGTLSMLQDMAKPRA